VYIPLRNLCFWRVWKEEFLGEMNKEKENNRRGKQNQRSGFGNHALPSESTMMEMKRRVTIWWEKRKFGSAMVKSFYFKTRKNHEKCSFIRKLHCSFLYQWMINSILEDYT
jgi:hypothetical protein